MSKEQTKQHFAELCECIWAKIQSEAKMDRKTAADMRLFVSHFAMMAWNISLFHGSFSEIKKEVARCAAGNWKDDPAALCVLMDAAELKWHEYRDDKELIVTTEIKTVKGKPRAVAYLKGERPEIERAASPFHDFMNSPEIRERLKHTPPEKLEEEIGKIVAEYNASLPEPPAAACDVEDAEDRDFPLTRAELDDAYAMMKEDASPEEKAESLAFLLKYQPFLAPLCRNAATKDSVPDIILAVASAYLPDTDLIAVSKDTLKDVMRSAKDFASAFIRDEEDFYDMIAGCAEPDLLAFLAETVGELHLPPKEYRQTLTKLIAWGIMLESARVSKHPDRYPDFAEEGDEKYDFDPQNLRLFYLHVKLRGYRASVDLTAPEDTTFEQLHTILNAAFQREDDHLYRFECDDGCVAVCNEEDEEVEEGDAVPAGKCYLGHHLERGSKVYYVFDYGDFWEHDITVKKAVKTPPAKCHFGILKITGEIPEQYPEEEDEE